MKKKAKTRRKAKPRIMALELLGGGALRKARLTEKKQLMFAVFRWRRGEMIEIASLPRDPYSAGHSFYKAMEAMASVYAAGTGRPFTEAFGLILGSLIDHSEEQLKNLLGSDNPIEDAAVAILQEQREAAVHDPELGGKPKKVH